ncbi:MAG: dihydrofolate reductase [Oscillospiraceae bacterium]|nr:dihydrofolate reductase [Oscillospiraceae bacterium]
MTIILAADCDWAIGKNGGLLAHIPEDMKYFRETTKNSTVVMGRKTWDSFPKKPLPNRVNCVISRSVKELDGAKVFGSVEEFLDYSKSAESRIFVIGGGEIYRQFLPYCDEALITRIYECFDGDVFFTDLEHDKDWELAEVSPAIDSECRTIRFFRYVRKK